MNNDLIIDYSAMSKEELIEFKKVLEGKYALLCEQRAEELAAIATDDFDPYSSSGERKINKILKKYENDDDGFHYLYEQLLKEFEQRQISIVDLEIKESNSLSDEDYIAREVEKTKKFKSQK